MKYGLIISKGAEKEISKLPVKQIKRIRKSFDKILGDPLCGKKLQGRLSGLYSLRVWPYRVIYKIKSRKLLILVLKVGHRQKIYK